MDKIKAVTKKTGSAGMQWVTDFKTFISRGSVVDLAVGIIIGAAFTAIVNSIVKDLITPIIALAGGKNMENLFAYLKPAPVCVAGGAKFDQALCDAINTLEEAQEAGAVTWNYGRFINAVINFFLVALILFFILKAYTASFLRKKEVEAAAPTTRDCPFCLSECKIKAVKCCQCGSSLPAEMEDKISSMSEIIVKTD